MDVRNAKVEPTIEHEGTCLTYFMFPKNPSARTRWDPILNMSPNSN